jgi:alkylated DNA repair dioxygenase AlkB
MNKVTVCGLSYQSNFIDGHEQAELVRIIDGQPWLTDLKRRVQHYGYKYDYRKRAVSRDAYLGPLPEWAQPIARRLLNETAFTREPDQLIVNEYEPGQGIASHTDCEPCFDAVIASISLGSVCVMDLTSPEGSIHEFLLEPGSLLVLDGDARYRWKHGIRPRKSDR